MREHVRLVAQDPGSRDRCHAYRLTAAQGRVGRVSRVAKVADFQVGLCGR